MGENVGNSVIESVKVSIITVSYNAEKTIEKTILSVLDQTYKNIEYIIIDGQSTDGTIEIIRRYIDRLAVFLCEPDEGLYYAMNKGLRKATGDIVGIINSDDWYEKDAVESVVNAYDTNSCDVIYGDIYLYDSEGKRSQQQELPLSTMWFQMAVPHPSVFVKRELYNRWGHFSTLYRIASDYDLMLRFFSNGAKFYHLKKVLASFSYGGLSTEKALSGRYERYRIVLSYLHKSPDPEDIKCIIDKEWGMDKFNLEKERDNIAIGNIVGIEKKRIVVFGIGKWGHRLLSLLKIDRSKEIIVVDNDYKNIMENEKILDIQNPEILKNENAVVVIAIKDGKRVLDQVRGYKNPDLDIYDLQGFITKIMYMSDEEEARRYAL